MVVNGVNFIDAAALRMTEDDFVRKHSAVFFQDMPEERREKVLRDIYRRIVRKNGRRK